MKIIEVIKETWLGILKSIKRFPISIVLSASTAAFMITISEIRVKLGYNDSFIETFERAAMISALGVPLSLCIKLFFEKKTNIRNALKAFICLAAILFLILYYFFLLTEFRTVQISRYIALSLSFYMAFLFIPYLKDKDNFELYVIRLLTRLFITIIYSLVLFLGISAILFTIDKLLGIYIKERIYYYNWLITAGGFAPIFFLAGVPAADESLDDYEYPKFLKILILFIVMPLITVYLSILYIYFAKIIITYKWPIGLVSHLVLWYSTLCVNIIFLISPIKNNNWINRFIFWFPKFIFPVLLMMFISIGIRIKAYGITENRYYVVILGLWVFAMMLYFNLNKIKRNIIMPISFSVILLLSVFGPLSSFTLSMMSQNSRFTSILVKNNMLDESKNLKAKPDVSEKDKKDISSILEYFERNHSLKYLKYLPKDFELYDMEKVFGFPFANYNPYTGGEAYLNYSIKDQNELVNISGYDYLLDFRYIKGQSNIEGLKMIYNYDNSDVKVLFYGKEIFNMNVSDYVNKIYSKYGNANTVDREDMVFESENQYAKIKFIFLNINGVKDKFNGIVRINGADFYILVKLKP